MPKIIIRTILLEENNLRLDKWFHHQEIGLPFSYVQKLCRSGQVRINGKRVKSNHRIKAGDSVRFPFFKLLEPIMKESRSYSSKDHAIIDNLIINIVFQDKDYIVLNKPSGLAVQGGTNIDHHLSMLLPLLSKCLSLPNKTLHIPHRLDRDTSGLLIIAKSSLASKNIAEAFKEKKIQKRYLALCNKYPTKKSGKITMKISKDKGKNKRTMVQDNKYGKEAITQYTCLDKTGKIASLLELVPLTGRTHQLRVACQKLGCPVIGDKRYNPASSLKEIMMLHAWQLIWTEKKWEFTAPLSPEFTNKAFNLNLKLP